MWKQGPGSVLRPAPRPVPSALRAGQRGCARAGRGRPRSSHAQGREGAVAVVAGVVPIGHRPPGRRHDAAARDREDVVARGRVPLHRRAAAHVDVGLSGSDQAELQGGGGRPGSVEPQRPRQASVSTSPWRLLIRATRPRAGIGRTAMGIGLPRRPASTVASKARAPAPQTRPRPGRPMPPRSAGLRR